MDQRIADHLANADSFTALVASVPADRWGAPSPCDDWTAADVVQHVVDTQHDFLAQRGATLPDAPEGSPAERWAAHDAAVRDVLADEAFATTPYDGYFGPTTLADTLRDFYGWDLVVHRWDLGRAVGQEVTWTDAERAFVGGELETFGDQLYARASASRPSTLLPVPTSRPACWRCWGGAAEDFAPPRSAPHPGRG